LQSLPEFEDITPITNDLLALWIQYLQNNTSNIQIVNNTNVDEFTRIVNMTYTAVNNAGTILPFDDYTVDRKSMQMFVLSPDRTTGYAIISNLSNTQTQQH
jgi:hypothetical protein